MRPYYIIRFLYGLAGGELGKDYVDYTDMVTNWDTNIAPAPPSLIVYNAAEAKLLNMETIKIASIQYYKDQQNRFMGVSGVSYGLGLKDTIDLILDKLFLDYHMAYFGSLSEVDDEKVLEFLTLKEEQTITNISNVNVPSLSPAEITDLLNDYNITEYEELRLYGWYFLTIAIGVDDETAKNAVLESHNFYATDTLTGNYIGLDIDDIIETLIPESSFWAYDLDNNVIFSDTEVQIPITSAKTYAASWYTPSSLLLITGGGFDINEDGIYQIELVMNIEENTAINEARKTYVSLDINGTKHIIGSGYQLICSGDVMTINASESIPLESGDNLKVYLNSDSGALESLNHASGYIVITKTK